MKGPLPMPSHPEIGRRSTQANATPVPDGAELLHEMSQHWMCVGPDAVAVVCGDVQISYGVLESRSNQLARYLIGIGVGVDDVVAVAVPRSVDLLVVLLAVLKAGAGYLPVDLEAPPARVEQVVLTAGVRVCVAGSESRVLLPAGIRVVNVESEWSVIEGLPVERPRVAVSGQNVVSVYFTSGSTGVPKGVVNTHAGWVNRLAVMRSQHVLEAGESVLHKTTLTFVDAALELFWPLAVGARVVMLDAGAHRDPAAVVKAVSLYRSVYLQVVPSLLSMILDVVEEQGDWLINSLRTVTSSGEALPPRLVSRFQRLLPGVSLRNTWGATEVSIDATDHDCTPADAVDTGAVSIGRPIGYAQVYVLDENLSMLEPGASGDLYVAGAGLARGYLRDPARTAARFVPDPYQFGARMYATGDRGYHRPDGALKYDGRKDHQVKIRGMRVELGEIEAQLHDHPRIRHAVVTVHEGRSELQRLVAFVTPSEPTAPPETREVRDYLAQLLPGHMVPSLILVLDQLPLTSNGKIDRRALVVPEDVRGNGVMEFVPCSGPVEEALAAMWCELLGLTRVGALDDFFELGAHSLLASRLVARIRQRFGLDLPLHTVFSRPTIRGLAEELETLQLRQLDSLSESELRALLEDG